MESKLADSEVIVDLYEQTGGPEPRFRTIVATHLHSQNKVQISGLFSRDELRERAMKYLSHMVEGV